ncbi:hypothetical protein VZT92_021678 [Zoarces viviparus]|uniref:Uncharacterized protein n=1 Tax=Zoarces viviparus TaxID=48416 RepID=A0AAW1E8R7_ZOAVI
MTDAGILLHKAADSKYDDDGAPLIGATGQDHGVRVHWNVPDSRQLRTTAEEAPTGNIEERFPPKTL